MKNIVLELIQDLYRKIPNEILREAFFEELKSTRTLDAILKEKVIIGIVLPNCNLYAGKMKMITLYESYGKRIEDDNLYTTAIGGSFGIYHIPLEVREGRPISAILDVSYPTMMSLFGSYPNVGIVGRSVTNGFDQMLSSFTHEPAYIAPSGIVLDSDAGLIQLSPPASIHVDWMVSCMLSFDNEFSNIGLNMVNPLKRLTELAAKGLIYNRLIIKLNQGYIQGGLQLESIKGIIDSYEGANELFDEALLKFRSSALFIPENLRGMISIMVGS